MTRFAVFFCVCALGSAAFAQDSSNVTCLGRLDGASGLNPMVLRDHLLYVGSSTIGQQLDDNAGLWIVDVTNPTQPVARGQAGVAAGGSIMGIALTGDYACLAILNQGFAVVNVTDPDHPQLTGSLVLDGTSPMDVQVRDTIAYLSYYAGDPSGAFKTVSIADPAHPRVLGSCFLGGYPKAVELSGNYAYVSGSDFSVVDISDPTAPAIVSQNPELNATVMDISGDRLYLSASSGMTVMDISNPRQPQVIAQSSSNAGYFDLVVAGDHVFTAGDNDGMSIFDISDLTSIHETGHYRLYDAYTFSVLPIGNYVYMTDDASLYILDCSAALAADDPRSTVVPAALTLSPAYPNPFNPSTTIRFSLPRASSVNVKVFDVTGRLVQTLADQRFEAGAHSLKFDGRSLSSGTYFARLSLGSFERTQRVVLAR